MPYTRPKGKKDKNIINKKEYEYDKDMDVYVCPVGCTLTLSTINKEGYKEYKSDKKECESCPMKEQCTKSKNNQKIITRHIWQEKKDEVNKERFTENFKNNYPHRKETVEMIFGDSKEQHGLRFTRLRGLEKNSNQALLIFTCHNLKKMGLWRWKSTENASQNGNYFSIFRKIIIFFKKKSSIFQKYTTLSTN